MAVKPIPDGMHSVTPYFRVEGAAKVIEFAKKAFGATEMHRMDGPNGTIMHAQFKIGDSPVMIADANDSWKAMPASIYVYLEDTDAAYKRAIEAGGVSLREPTDEFYGDRSAGVRDSGGNEWWIATHQEDVAPAEMERRMKAEMDRRSKTRKAGG